MFIKKVDFLSPKITFYYKGALSHSSIFSGIISIISILLIILLALYFSLDIIKRKNPKAFYFNSFIDDAGIFPLNSSSLFHYISMYEKSDDIIDKGIEFRNFRIIGLNTYYHYYLEDKNLSKYDHWLYGFCNNESDTQGISHLIDKNFFKSSACIRKYFSSSEQKYFDTSDPNFKWPIIAHGTLNPNKTFYNIILERCKEETINYILGEGHHCSNDDEMDKIFELRGAIHLNFIDNYVNILNYEEPYNKSFYRIENALDRENYSINNLNFNPIKVETNNGIIFDKFKTSLSYIYDRNDVLTHPINNSEIYMVYYFWLNNRMNFYERVYKKIQEVISNIGGISQVIYFCSLFINHLYNNYIIISDTEKLLSSSIDDEKNLNKNSNMHNSLRKSLNIYSSKCVDIINDNSEKRVIDDKLLIKESNKDSSINNNNCIPSQVGRRIDKSGTTNEIKNKDNNGIVRESVRISKNEMKNFFSYLIFKFSFEKKNKSFKVYEDFRTKIISEEHLIRNHLNIYNLLRFAQEKINFARNSFKIKDLINLV